MDRLRGNVLVTAAMLFVVGLNAAIYTVSGAPLSIGSLDA